MKKILLLLFLVSCGNPNFKTEGDFYQCLIPMETEEIKIFEKLDDCANLVTEFCGSFQRDPDIQVKENEEIIISGECK